MSDPQARTGDGANCNSRRYRVGGSTNSISTNGGCVIAANPWRNGNVTDIDNTYASAAAPAKRGSTGCRPGNQHAYATPATMT